MTPTLILAVLSPVVCTAFLFTYLAAWCFHVNNGLGIFSKAWAVILLSCFTVSLLGAVGVDIIASVAVLNYMLSHP